MSKNTFEKPRMMRVLIFDDTAHEKPHSNENEFISWHFDGTISHELKVLTCCIVFVTY